MRIAHVTATFPPYWGGTGNVAYNNARVLHEWGHDVTVFTSGPVEQRSVEVPYDVRYLDAPFRLGNAPLAPSLLRLLRGWDIIHLHYPYIFGTEMALLAQRIYRTPLVLTYHNQLRERCQPKSLLFAGYNATGERMALRRASRILAVRMGHFQALHPDLSADSRLRELHNGVDTMMFRPHDASHARAQLGIPDDRAVALFVGALDRAHRFKNVEGLLHAFARCSRQDALLILCGDGDLRPSLEECSRRLGIGHRVRFLGRRRPDQLASVYSAADVTVLPSSDVESFGMVLIESLACGTPVIASDLPGVRDAVRPGIDGMRVVPGDVQDLTRALDEMLGNRQRGRAMGASGRAYVSRTYGWHGIGHRLESIYAEVLELDAARHERMEPVV